MGPPFGREAAVAASRSVGAAHGATLPPAVPAPVWDPVWSHHEGEIGPCVCELWAGADQQAESCWADESEEVERQRSGWERCVGLGCPGQA